MLVHIFQAIDSPSCANFDVKTAAKDILEKYSAVTTETVLRSFYFDDLWNLVTSKQAVSLIKEMVDLMKAGWFRLTKFISNKENVMETILEMKRTKSLQVWTFNSDIKERTLSIKGDVVKDSFKFESLMLEREVTKRAILKIVASIFDPLGLVTRVMENEIR